MHVLAFWLLTSWYGPGFEGRRTASGEVFVGSRHTCASKWLRFGTILDLVRGTHRSWCRVNDRGPFVRGRDLDISPAVAYDLHLWGVSPVYVKVRY